MCTAPNGALGSPAKMVCIKPSFSMVPKHNFLRLLNQSLGVLIAEFYTLANEFLQLNGKQIFIEPPDLKHVEDYRYILRLILEKRKEKKEKK